MPARTTEVRHVFGGGLATELGSVADVGSEGTVEVPFLLRAENIYFQRNGAIRKIGGTTKWNSAALESGEEIRGMFEYIKIGTLGAPSRKKIVYTGTKVKADANNGTFADIITGLTNDAIPCFTVFEDILILSSTATGDAPRTYDGTTAGTLGGTPPNFSISCSHANRLWVAGDPLNPSQVTYSGLLDATDWTVDAGTIDVDPNDGDVVTGLRSFRGELLVFKGPNRGSIHRISGLQPADFERIKFVDKISAVWNNLIFDLGSDLGFVWSDGTIRSFLATNKFGDFDIGALSRDIDGLILDRMNADQLARGWAATDPLRGYTLFTLPFDSSNVPNLTLCMDMRFGEPRFSTWTAISGWSVARMSDPSNNDRQILWIGGNDGFIRKTQQPTRVIDSATPINASIQLPFLYYGTPNKSKTLNKMGLGIVPRGESNVNINLRAETTNSQTSSISGGGAVLGPAATNVFTLDSSTLEGDAYRTIWVDVPEAGQFRELSIAISNGEASQDLEMQSIHLVIETELVENYENTL